MNQVDPSSWSIDQVIGQICSRNSRLYTSGQIQIKAVLNLDALNNTLRTNDIDGEALLSLEDVNVKEDLGISSFGQRREIQKIIHHLRNVSALYKASLEDATPKRPLDSDRDEAKSSTLSPIPQPQPKKRRIQPENLSTIPLTAPEEFNPQSLSEEWQDFLHRHRQAPDEEVFRPYNESDLEKELDSDDSLVDELMSEPITPEPRLTQSEVDQAIDESIEEFKELWNGQKRVKKYQTAYRRWMQAAQAMTRKPQQNALKNELQNLELRLDKFRNAIADRSIDYHKVEEVKRNCLNLQTTVEEIAERKYYLQVLESNQPPEKPENTQPLSLPLEGLADGDEILQSSESEQEVEDETHNYSDHMSWVSDEDSGLSLPYDPTDSDWNPQIPQVNVAMNVYREATNHSTSAVVQQYHDAVNTYVTSSDDPFSSSEDVHLPRPHSYKQIHNSFKQQLDSPVLAKPNQILLRSFGEEEEADSDLDRERLPQSRYRGQGTTRDNAISLQSSPASSEHSFSTNPSVRTPPLNPSTPSKVKFGQDRPTLVNYPPIQELRAKKWAEISDPFLALCKIVYRHARTNARDVLEYSSEMTTNELPQALRATISEIQDTEEEDIPEDSTADPAIMWTFFFIVYTCNRGYRDVWDVPESSLDAAYEMANMKAAEFNRNLKPLLRWYIDTETEVANKQSVQTTVHNHQVSKSRSTQKVLPEIPSSDLSDYQRLRLPGLRTPPTDTDTEVDERIAAPNRRKRHVQQSQEALAQQRDDKHRVQAQEERRQLVMQRFQAQVSTGGDRLVPVRTTEPYIYLDPHIARRVKGHQIEGIQFIWRELIEDPKHQGCLLAHTMGLGKTMQVISFLVTLAQAKRSTDPRISGLIPDHLHGQKTIVICPASLVDNWYDEILMWTPPDDIDLLGGIYKVFGVRSAKLRTLNEWNEDPGILIISYESLKSILSKNRTITDEEHDAVTKALLYEPSVVIADEAHKMKNAKSAVNKVAKQFITLSRIALTGSPLNNHLEEYHTMIDWIAPGYLGNRLQFRSKYIEPIERGLYADSSKYEKRKSVEKLYILKKDLAPKIDRKDISAIEKDMPQKTEFFITVPLTELQKEIYSTMVQHILSGLASTNSNTPKSSNAQLWSWLAILSWLCNHPSCLIRKLQEKDDGASKTTVVQAEEDDESVLPSDVNLRESSIVSLLPRFLDAFRTIGMLNAQEDVTLSTRSIVTQMLISESVRQGEKILVFSHSIPTLDFLQTMLENMQLRFMRIDGSTRTDQRQNATKSFNDRDSNVMVFLISTRAGGLGLNLQGANRVIIYDFNFNPSWEEQAIGRAYRLGQQKAVFVYRFRAGGTFEEAMYNKSIFKTQLFSRVVDQKNVIRHASKKIEDYLFPPTDPEQHDLSECLGKDALLDRVVSQAPTAIRNLVLTETFQREDEDDEITAAERQQLDEEVELEHLYRTNPTEHSKRIAERRQKEVQNAKVVVNQHSQDLPGPPSMSFSQIWNSNTMLPKGIQQVGRANVLSTQQATDTCSKVLRDGDMKIGESSTSEFGNEGSSDKKQ